MQTDPSDVVEEKTTAEDVARDLGCARCGYNLRGLSHNATCPECGVPVKHSLHGPWLRYADRRWAKQTLRGLQWVMVSRAAIAIGLFLAIGAGVAGLLMIPRGIDTPIESAFTITLMIINGILAVLPIGMAYGFWLASAPEPRAGAESPYSRIRTRVVSILAVPAFGLWIAIAPPGAAIPGSLPIVLDAIAIACFLIVWLHFHVVLHQVATLERRCAGSSPDRFERIAKYRNRAIYLPALLILLHWVGPGRWLFSAGWSAPPEPIGFFLMGIGWLIVTGILTQTIRLMRAELTAVGTTPRA